MSESDSKQGSGKTKTLSIVSYITWIGFLVAVIAGDLKTDDILRRNVNQALVLNLASLLCFIPHVGGILSLVITVFLIMAIVGACGKDGFKPVPLLGKIVIIKG